jgi:hypothetical protein
VPSPAHLRPVTLDFQPCGIDAVDALATADASFAQLIAAMGAYICETETLQPLRLVDDTLIDESQRKKTARIRLAGALGRALCNDLAHHCPSLRAESGEIKIPGEHAQSQVDIAERSVTGDVRLAVELKPIHLAVGRAMHNRFKDVVFHCVNVHLAWPRAVAGGVITVPVWEQTKTGRKSTLGQVRDLERMLSGTSGHASHRAGIDLAEAHCLVVLDLEQGLVHTPTTPPRRPGCAGRTRCCAWQRRSPSATPPSLQRARRAPTRRASTPR